jgi:hypothetical protein
MTQGLYLYLIPSRTTQSALSTSAAVWRHEAHLFHSTVNGRSGNTELSRHLRDVPAALSKQSLELGAIVIAFGRNPTTARRVGQRRSDVLPDIVRQSSVAYYAARAKSLGEFERIQELPDISGPLIGPQHSSRLRVNSDELPASTKIGIEQPVQ